jgi:hypothetical protein
MTLRAASRARRELGTSVRGNVNFTRAHWNIFGHTSCHESNDRLDSIRLFETVATESGRSTPLNVPPACEPHAPGPNQLGAHLFGGSKQPQGKTRH